MNLKKKKLAVIIAEQSFDVFPLYIIEEDRSRGKWQEQAKGVFLRLIHILSITKEPKIFVPFFHMLLFSVKFLVICLM